MNSFLISIVTIPISCVAIALVYIWQYRVPRPVRPLFVCIHFLAVSAIISSYWLLCYNRFSYGWHVYPGLMLFTVGSYIFWKASFFHRASLVPNEEYGLVKTGLYRRIRHPIYSGGLLAAFGLIGVAPHMEVIIAWMVLFFSLLGLVAFEEWELKRRVGVPYLHYCKQTKRLIPWVL